MGCFVIFLLISSITLLDAMRFRCDYTYMPQIASWLKLHRSSSDRKDAHKICKTEGAELAPTNIIAVKKAIGDLLRSDTTILDVHVSSGQNFTLKDGPIPEEKVLILTDSGNGTSFEVKKEYQYPLVCYKAGNTIKELNTDCGIFDDQYFVYNISATTHKCYKMHYEVKNYREALSSCSMEKAHLAVIDSEAEAQAIKNIFKKKKIEAIDDEIIVAFMGFASKKGHSWRTIEGGSIFQTGYNQWYEGEPRKIENESCGSVDAKGLLHTSSCTRYLPYICEREIETISLCTEKQNTLQ